MVFFCKFCETFKNKFFVEHPWCLLLQIYFSHCPVKYLQIVLKTNVQLLHYVLPSTFVLLSRLSFSCTKISSSIPSWSKQSSLFVWHIWCKTQHVMATAETFPIWLSNLLKQTPPVRLQYTKRPFSSNSSTAKLLAKEFLRMS